MLKFFKLLFIVIVIILSGCEADSPGMSSGTVNLNISFENSAKTIIYDLSSDDIASLRIDFIDGPTQQESKTFEMDSDISFTLSPGSWSIDIYGFDLDSNEIVYSDVSFSISSTEEAHISAVLRPLMHDTSESSASGSASITMDWSSVNSSIQKEISEVTATFGLIGDTSEDISSDLNIDISIGTATFVKDPCPSGNYIIVFCIVNEEGTLIASASEAVNVRDNLLSEGTISLENGDFNLNGISINISVDLPEVEKITFSYSTDESFTTSEISDGVTVSVANDTDFESYEWSMDGSSQYSETKDLELPLNLATGIHHLTAYVEKEGDLLSGTLRFSVTD